jgi:RNA polymerase sigma-70 factor (ECF subfamily)
VTNETTKLENIIKGCIEQDSKAQEQLFKMMYGKMMSVCLRYMGDVDEAKDVLQDGFIKLFDKIDKYNFNGSFEGWMRRMFVNTSIDAIRKKKRDPFNITDEARISEEYSDEFGSEDNESTALKAKVAMDAVQMLSPAYRTVFNLYVIENYTHKEIGEILGVSEGTSKSNLAKAKQKLRSILTSKFDIIDNQ